MKAHKRTDFPYLHFLVDHYDVVCVNVISVS